MAKTDGPYADTIQGGEYGATRVYVSQDGSSTRIAFGRSGHDGTPIYYGAFIISPEALTSLKEQLAEEGL